MSNEGASVLSISAIDDFKVALSAFAQTVKSSLELADLEIRHSLDWVSQHQLAYWKGELRRREEAVGAAAQDLHRARMSLTAFGHVPDCADQKAALAKAKARLEEAEGKLRSVRQWTLLLTAEIDDYRGPSRQLLATLEGDIPKALALLERLLRSLESYVTAGAPGPAPIEFSAGMATAARPVEPEPNPVSERPDPAKLASPQADAGPKT